MEAIFRKILEMSLSAGVVVLAVLAARLILRRAPRRWSYLLWAAVGFRLCCPVSIPAAFSLFRLTALLPAAAQHAPIDVGSTGMPAIPLVSGGAASPAYPTPVIGGAAQTVSQTAAAPAAHSLFWWLALIWIVGAAALLFWGLIGDLRLQRRLIGATRTEDGVWETDRIKTPFILGLPRPKIYLPLGLTGEVRAWVLAHERQHIRCGDPWARLAAYILLCLHWFNPLCWLAFILMGRDMELRCDEAVLTKAGSGGPGYSEALLQVAANRRFPAPGPLAFGETDVKTRIKNALNWKRPRFWVTLAAVVLCAVVVAVCVTNPGGKKTFAELLGYDTAQVQALSASVTGGTVDDSEKPSNETETVNLTGAEARALLSILDGSTFRKKNRYQAVFEDAAESVTLTLQGLDGNMQTLFFCEGVMNLAGHSYRTDPEVTEALADAIRMAADAQTPDESSAAPDPDESQAAALPDLPDAPYEDDFGPGFSPDGQLPVHRYDGDGWYIYIPITGWTLTEASEVRTKWTSENGSTLVVRHASPEELAAERPQLTPGQAESYYPVFPAEDGGYWLVFTQYDPKLELMSSWAGKEPELLQRMTDSFRVIGAESSAPQLTAEIILDLAERADTLTLADLEAYAHDEVVLNISSGSRPGTRVWRFPVRDDFLVQLLVRGGDNEPPTNLLLSSTTGYIDLRYIAGPAVVADFLEKAAEADRLLRTLTEDDSGAFLWAYELMNQLQSNNVALQQLQTNQDPIIGELITEFDELTLDQAARDEGLRLFRVAWLLLYSSGDSWIPAESDRGFPCLLLRGTEDRVAILWTGDLEGQDVNRICLAAYADWLAGGEQEPTPNAPSASADLSTVSGWGYLDPDDPYLYCDRPDTTDQKTVLLRLRSAETRVVNEPEDWRTLWYSIFFYGEGPSYTTGIDPMLMLCAGLPENVVQIRWNGIPRDSHMIYVEDPVLYAAVRNCYDFEAGPIDPDYSKYRDVLAAHAQGVMDNYNDALNRDSLGDIGTLIKAETLRFERVDSFPDEDEARYAVYYWDVAYTPSDIRKAFLAGGAAIDAQMRLRGYEPIIHFVVDLQNGEYRFMSLVLEWPYAEENPEYYREIVYEAILKSFGAKR